MRMIKGKKVNIEKNPALIERKTPRQVEEEFMYEGNKIMAIIERSRLSSELKLSHNYSSTTQFREEKSKNNSPIDHRNVAKEPEIILHHKEEKDLESTYNLLNLENREKKRRLCLAEKIKNLTASR
jgi:hypothetical protein